jgi:enoyl-CoA hydratase
LAILEYSSVALVKRGAVAVVTIQRPEHLNALNPDVLQSLIVAFAKIEEDHSIRVVLLQGAGEKAFVAGADIRAMFDLGPRAIADFIELGQRAVRAIELCRAPVIVAVQGYALGGGLEVALAADLILASIHAKLGLPEVNLGVIPGFGGTQRLISRCGVGTARHLTLTGDLVGAEDAKILGLVDKVLPAEAFDNETLKFAQKLSEKAPLALSAAKRVINKTVEGDQLAGMRREVEAFLALFATEDREEGMTAFLEKRKASFAGR